MGSRLEVSSVYGEGSEFSFAISQPVRSLENVGDYQNRVGERNAVLAESESFHAQDARLLVIDDVEMNLVVAKNLLKADWCGRACRAGAGTGNCQQGRRRSVHSKEDGRHSEEVCLVL